MSQENVELLNRAIDALNRRDIDTLLAICDRDVEFTPLIMAMEGGHPFRGHDGVRTWWKDLFGVFPDVSLMIDEVRDLGEITAARACLRGHGTESGTPMEQTLWLFAEWRGGKCMRWGACESEAKALEAAGLSE